MNKIIYYLMIILFALSALSCVHTGEGTTARYYNEKGKYVGKSESQSNRSPERFYDAKGEFIGKSETSGNSVRYYDSKGKYIGKSNKLNFNR